MKKISVVVTCLFMMSATNVLAQDLCDSYLSKYQVCVGAGEAGSNLDIADCASYIDKICRKCKPQAIGGRKATVLLRMLNQQ